VVEAVDLPPQRIAVESPLVVRSSTGRPSCLAAILAGCLTVYTILVSSQNVVPVPAP
jgi:hypothetical protein